MIGAIIGDIVGSVYEWKPIKTKKFPLWSADCSFTDDTVMTIAIGEGMLNGGTHQDFIDSMKKFGRRYPTVGYGARFAEWIQSEQSGPYNSWGNGSAMRVSAIGWLCGSLDEVERYAKISAEVTHNHPEGVKGAQAIAGAVFLARTGKSKKDIKAYIEHNYDYHLNRTLEQIRPDYRFQVSCLDSVPEALIAFLESVDLEDAIRNAVSLGGDSDTLAAIAGSIAEAAYGVPNDLKERATSFLDEGLLRVCHQFWSRL